jgi:signal transduction histidine kinase
VASGRTDADFAGLVSLACHDLRTPLATVIGFVRTLPRVVDADERASRYLALMDAAAEQLSALLDDLSLAARIESGRYDPLVGEADTLQLARSAAERTTDGKVEVGGRGAAVAVDVDSTVGALAHLARCALRHGGLERVRLDADGPGVALSPVARDIAPILLGEDLRDMGAAVAVRAIAAIGGSTSAEDDHLVVLLPLAPRPGVAAAQVGA